MQDSYGWPFRPLLLRHGLLFDDDDQERRFYRRYVADYRTITQVMFLVGAGLYYTFFVWDQILDPVNSGTTHAIRGLVVVPYLLIGAAILSTRFGERWFEPIVASSVSLAMVVIGVIYTFLATGYQYGAVGFVLIAMFAFTGLHTRLMYFVLFSLVTIATLLGCTIATGNLESGLFVVNGLSVATALFLGLFSATRRELQARAKFLADQDLATAKDRVEELLHSLLPGDIVERIQQGETTIADAHADVSVVFADLVGFTDLSRRVSPKYLVELLSRLFSSFDEVAERYGIEKIKTIGDAYMAVAGLGRTPSDHVIASAEFALEMRRIVASLSSEFGVPLNVRIGLHSGPVVAGVIGTKRPAFDCWGESVNIASRLENSAEPGVILVSEAAYFRLRHQYEIEVLEGIDLKGIGPITAFILRGRQTTLLPFVRPTQSA